MNEHGPYRLLCLNPWSPVNRTVWGRIGGVTHWRLALGFKKHTLEPVSLFLPTACGSGCKHSASCLPACLPLCVRHDDHGLTCGVGLFIHRNRTVPKTEGFPLALPSFNFLCKYYLPMFSLPLNEDFLNIYCVQHFRHY